MSKKDSGFTKKCRALLWTYRIVDLLVLFLPLSVYIGFAYASGVAPTHTKIALTGCISIALILTLFNIIAKKHLRSPIWIVVIGLYCVIGNLLPLIIMIAGATVLDEFVFAPLITHYRTKLVANKAIDERGL